MEGRVIPQGDAPRKEVSQKEKEIITKEGNGKGWSWGQGVWQVDGEENQGDREWNPLEEEKPGSIEGK